MRKSVIAIIVIVLVVLYMSVFVVRKASAVSRCVSVKFCATTKTSRWCMRRLHFKIPFIESVKMLDARIQTMDNQG